ncbi:RimK family alpha-L-glutamate ligase [Acinetobacter sp. YH12105]|uniref:ATP-grasp domain-containing protein n=1 Tax=Acinetobacter sp. YH12105 TaxID=2601093 RepID=UPI0015D3EBF4|nr:hypothetical protein [Acinetobacter sp. YH12105]
MKLAIHQSSNSFSERWIQYCKKENIEFKIVDAFDSNIIKQLEDCNIFMWHHHHAEFKDVIAAKRILFALEHAGIKVFPNFKTGWHFDDKVAQKYLLEAINAPLVPSYVFYDKNQALNWAKETSYPKVFKLKGGAGAANVKLVKNHNECIKLIKKSFGKGFSQFDRINNLKDSYKKYKNGQYNFKIFLKSIARSLINTDFSKKQPNEKGYIYFQEFMPNNECDIRVIVIGSKAFAIKRLVRENDFRASGSGSIIYNPLEIDINCVKLAFEINEKAGFECIAYDFIYNDQGVPLIVEISYGFSMKAYDTCPGYWDNNLNWYEGEFNPQGWMVELLCEDFKTISSLS